MSVLAKEELIKQIQKLPQAKFISKERADNWLEMQAKVATNEIEWLIKRMYGFGGSDMGALVADFRNEYSPFSSAKDIVRSKLLLDYPEAASADINRGNFFEPIVQRIFHERNNTQTDDESMQSIIGADHSTFDPVWMVGNPDDIVIIKNRRYIVDYKAPKVANAVAMRDLEIPLGYNCQLNHYDMIAEKLGIEIDGLILAVYEYDTNEVVPYAVDRDSQLRSDMLTAGDMYWNAYVMQGAIPEKQASKQVLNPDNISDDLKSLSEEYTKHALIMNSAKSKVDKIKELMAVELEKYELTNANKMMIGSLDISGRKSRKSGIYDVEAMSKKLEEKNVDLSSCYNKGPLNEESVLDLAYDNDIDVDKYWIEEEYSPEIGFTRAKKGERGENLTSLKEIANEAEARISAEISSSVSIHCNDLDSEEKKPKSRRKP